MVGVEGVEVRRDGDAAQLQPLKQHSQRKQLEPCLRLAAVSVDVGVDVHVDEGLRKPAKYNCGVSFFVTRVLNLLLCKQQLNTQRARKPPCAP